MKPDSTLYEGYRRFDQLENRDTSTGVRVKVNGKDLSPKKSQRIRNHSPDGFNWGYGGSGPAQLALAILLDFTGDTDAARSNYQAFKFAFVGKWGDKWSLQGAEIREWIEQHARATQTETTP